MNLLKIIITGATGMVGEGVMMACLQNDAVAEILLVSRKHYDISHPKVKELLLPDFNTISDEVLKELGTYDACFYCAGISSIGMKEDEYTRITYDTTLNFAKNLSAVNPNMVFTYVSGKSTDSTEQGKMMWARVKGKTENDLMKLSFKGVYNFRPGFMKPFSGQKNVQTIIKVFNVFYPALFPSSSLTIQQVAQAMVNLCIRGYQKAILEVKDIKAVAEG